MWNDYRKGPGICLHNSNPWAKEGKSILVIAAQQVWGNPENEKCILSVPDAEQACARHSSALGLAVGGPEPHQSGFI